MEMRSLPVILNEEEFKVRADQLAQKVKDLRAVESEKKIANDGFKGRIESVTGEINVLSNVVKERKEHRPVECSWEENFERYTMDLIRNDTGEQVDSRPMTAGERQPKLKGLDGKVDKIKQDKPEAGKSA